MCVRPYRCRFYLQPPQAQGSIPVNLSVQVNILNDLNYLSLAFRVQFSTGMVARKKEEKGRN